MNKPKRKTRKIEILNINWKERVIAMIVRDKNLVHELKEYGKLHKVWFSKNEYFLMVSRDYRMNDIHEWIIWMERDE